MDVKKFKFEGDCGKLWPNICLLRQFWPKYLEKIEKSLWIRCNKTKFFLWNTNDSNRNGVSKQKNAHKNHSEKVNTEGG